MIPHIRAILPCGGAALLGEAPSWWESAGLVIWTDIAARRLHLYDPCSGRDRSVPTRVPVTRVLCKGDQLLAITPHAICSVSPRFECLEAIASVDDLPEGSRLNDACLDPAGRIWIGSVGAPGRSGDGRLYRYGPHGFDLVATGYDACNGIGISPDHGTLYLTDTRRRVVLAHDFDVEAGILSRGRPFRQFSIEEGYPDGLSVAPDGGVWSAMWDGARILETRPGGRPGKSLAVPTARPTALLLRPDRLLLTSARQAADRAWPLDGMLFDVRFT